MDEPTTHTNTITEWAVQCPTRDGRLFTGRSMTQREEAEKSGQRLAEINGAEWWLATRQQTVTVTTTPWVRVDEEA